jgi:hypothetical protein
MKRYLFGLIAVLAFSIAGCGLLVDQGQQVLAKAGTESIRLDELLERIRALSFEQRAKTNDADPAVRLQARRSLLEQLVTEELLIQEAKARNIVVNDDEVEAVLAKKDDAQDSLPPDMAEGVGAASGHEATHEHEEHSQREIERIRLQLMVQKMLRDELDESKRRQYYEVHRQEFLLSPPQMVYELLILDKSNEGALQKIADKARSEKISLTNALSYFPNLPIIFCGKLPPAPVAALALSMQKEVKDLSAGQISNAFLFRDKSTERAAIARMVEVVDTVPYEQVREGINQKLYENFLKGLRQKYEVVYYQDRLDYRLEG